MPGRFLSDDDRLRLSNFPDEVAESDLAAYYTVEDLACIRHRGDANRLGFALQLCTLPFLGFVPDDLRKAPTSMVAFLAAQLNVSPSVLDEYADRSQTRTDHLAEAMEALGFRAPGLDDLAHLGAWLLERALEHDQPSLLFQMAAEYLRTHKLVRPGVTAIRSTMTRSRISRRPCTPTSTSTASTGSTSTAYRPGSSGPAPVPPSADAGNPLALVSVHLLTGPA